MNLLASTSYKSLNPFNIFMCLIYIFFLKYIYINVVAAQDGYRGFNYFFHGYLFEFFSLIFAILPLKSIEQNIEKPSTILIYIIYLFIYLPSVSVGINALENEFNSALVIFISIAILYSVIFFNNLLKINLTVKLNFSREIDFKVSIVLLVSLISFCIYSLQSSNFDLVSLISNSLYDKRIELRGIEMGNSLYVYAIIRSFVLITLLYLLFIWKNFTIRLILLACVLLILIDQFLTLYIRSHLYLFFFLSLILLGAKYEKLNFKNFVLIILLIVGTCLVLDIFFNTTIFSFTFSRRLFILPGVISAFYIDYISNNGTYFILERLSEAFNADEITYLVGTSVYMSQFDFNLNSNAWIMSYAYIGIVGIFATSFIIGVIMSLIDKVFEQFKVYSYLLFLYFSLIWVESSLWTSMLTGGIFVCFIFFLILNFSTSQSWVRYFSYKKS